MNYIYNVANEVDQIVLLKIEVLKQTIGIQCILNSV